MSLFNETVARAARAETALDECQKRCANLEIALKAAMRNKLNSGPYYPTANREKERELPGRKVSANHNELNTLSDSDIEEMFKARMAEQVDAGDLKSPAARRKGSIPFLGTIARLLQNVR